MNSNDLTDFQEFRERKRSKPYEEAIEFLESRNNYEGLRSFRYKDLENRLPCLRAFLDSLGSSDKEFTTIHITGTKGKGSTGIILEEILSRCGYKVGRFSSPHLHSLMERFTINGVPCEEEVFAEILLGLKDAILAHESDEPFTYFDVLVIVAMVYFARQQVRCAILEVGLGGRLDSTNVCHADISIITSISFDHIQQLGPTFRDIAREKAGIIKPRTPVVSGVRNAEAEQAIKEIAIRNEAPVYELKHDFQFAIRSERPMVYDYWFRMEKTEQPFVLSGLQHTIMGEHQVRNAAVALTAIMLLKKQKNWNVPEEAIRQGLLHFRLPARIETLRENPLLIVDGAHNRASVRALLDVLETMSKDVKERYLIFGAMLGKDVEGMLEELMPFFDHVIFTRCAPGPRAFPPMGLYHIGCLRSCEDPTTFCAALKAPEDFSAVHQSQEAESELERKSTEKTDFGDVVEEPVEALEKTLRLAGENDLICVTGSFYLAAQLREIVLRGNIAKK